MVLKFKHSMIIVDYYSISSFSKESSLNLFKIKEKEKTNK